MKADTTITRSLVDTLEELMQHPKDFQETVQNLFSYGYEDYNRLFEIDSIVVKNETYKRIPVFRGRDCVAILMIWGVDNITAIHDHVNYDGSIKVLKGLLTEVSYRENSNFIEYDGVGTALENHVFPEDFGGIHSIVNSNEGISVSLHVYRTDQLNLKGVRIFDTAKRRVAWLNENAEYCSWNLPADAYERIMKI